MTTRRARLRAETIDEIKRAAIDQIESDGAASLSLRGVARDIGMSPAGLYRYYDGRDALLTELITDAYTDLAIAVETAIASGSGSAAARLAAGIRAYRRWALAEPNRFLLIFGTPVPGYAAPEGGPTVEANRRMGQAFFALAAEALARGELDPEAGREPTPGELAFADEVAAELTLPAAVVGLLLGTWAHWHGIVALEVTHQFDWIYADDADTFFNGEIDRMLVAMGLQPIDATQHSVDGR
jgi:AcrR family transcriptional regulator